MTPSQKQLESVVGTLVATSVDFWDAIANVVDDEPREGALGVAMHHAARELLMHLADVPQWADEREVMAHLGDKVFARMVMRWRDATRAVVP